MFKKLSQYISGFVRIRIYSNNYEKIINRLAGQSIFIWKVIRNNSYLEANIKLKDFFLIKSVLKDLKKKIKIVKRQGLPFILRKYSKRKVFILGMLITYLILLTLSSLIWEINIKGLDKIKKPEIMKVLSESGVDTFRPRFLVNSDKVKENLYKSFSNIVWLNLYIKGTSINIEIVETISPTEIIDEGAPCNIVANKKAVIYNIVTIKGIPKVKAKDVVNPGDLLVSGEIEEEINGEKVKKYVNAMANIEGKNYMYIKVDQDLVKITKEYTGKTYRDIKLKFIGESLNFVKNKSPFKYFDKTDKVIKLLPSNGDSKIAYVVSEYKEYNTKIEQYSPEYVNEKLKEKVNQYISEKLPEDSKVLDVRVDYSFKENKAIANAIAIVIEKIGEKKIIENY